MPAGSGYWIEEGMLSNTIRNRDEDQDGKVDHVCFTVRNQFLHPNHPLGWIRKLDVKLDGQAIPPKRTYFVLRGQWINVACMPTITDIWWYMREEAHIYVESEGLEPGQLHLVACAFEISLFLHSPIVDRENIWPRLALELSSEMMVQDEENGG